MTRARDITGIIFSLAALLTMQPSPAWATEKAAAGTTDVTVRRAETNIAADVERSHGENTLKPLDQTSASHLPTMLLVGGMLCGGGAVALRGRKRPSDGGGDQ